MGGLLTYLVTATVYIYMPILRFAETIYQATACSRRPARDRTLALALLYVSLSLKS